MNEDIVLRAPLDGFHGNNSSSIVTCESEETARRNQRSHDDFVRSSISGMLVGASVLQLSLEARYTAAVLLHRYYRAKGIPEKDDSAKNTATSNSPSVTTTAALVMSHREQLDECKYVLAACLLLASKREEQPRRLRDLINVVHMIDWSTFDVADLQSDIPNLHDYRPSERLIDTRPADSSTSPNHVLIQPTTTIIWRTTPPPLDATYWASKRRLVQTEQRVLLYLVFDVAVSRPHRAVALLLQDDGSSHAILHALAHLNRPASCVSTNKPDGPIVGAFQLLQSAIRVLNGTVYSSEALHQAILPLAVSSIIVAAADGTPSAEPKVSSKATQSMSDVRQAASALVATQWWSTFVPVSVSEVDAAVASLQRLYYGESTL